MMDSDDKSFVEGLKELVNITDEEVKDFIEKCDIDQLNELSNAISTGDKRRALQIYYLLKNQKVAESVNRLTVGDLVCVGKVKARVQIPNGPGDTVGVMIGKKLRMVNKSKISLSEEMTGSILGMTTMPSISRMQELAGISNSEPEPSVTAEVVSDDSCDYDSDDEMTVAMNAISALRDVLPEVTLKDAKVIRRALSELLSSMNESAPPTGRKLKE